MKMKKCFAAFGCVLAAYTACGDALLIDEGKSVSIYNTTSYGVNDIIMGVDETGNGLWVYSDASLTAGDLYVGYGLDSDNNAANLMASSSLYLSGSLYVGYYSSSNKLTSTDGSLIVTKGTTTIGNASSSTGNKVTISGAESYWLNDGNINVGWSGSDNQLRINNDALVSMGGSLFIGANSTGDSNTVTVSDAVLHAGYDIAVGVEGAANELNVLDGSEVVCENTFVGVTNYADNNSVLITGGSVWTNNGSMYIGNVDNIGNSVTVSNNGALIVYEDFEIFGTGNSFNLDRDGSLTVMDDLDVSMDGFNFNEGGTLFVGGTLTGMTSVIDGDRTLGLTGTNAWWDQSGNAVAVGGASGGNGLYVEDGGWVLANSMRVGVTSDNNILGVSGADSLLQIANGLTIGSVSNSGNSVTVSDGAAILLGGTLDLAGTGNSFNLGDGGWLVASNGVDASASGFNFLAGGTLESMGTLSGLSGVIEDDRSVLLTGDSARWNLGANQLQVGAFSSSNSVYVTGGAQLVSGSALIGSSSTTGSLVYVSGAGSSWTNSGNLAADGYYNDLVIEDGAVVWVGGDLSVRNQSALSFASGGQAYASSYYQDADSVFSFDNITNTTPSSALLTVSGSAEFEEGATLAYTGIISELERGVVFTNRLVASSQLIVGGVTNASSADLDALGLTGLGSLLTIDLAVSDDDLIALITRMRLADSAGFSAGTLMADLSEEIDGMADTNARAESMLEVLSVMDSPVQNSQLSQLYSRHAPTYSHVKGMQDGFKQVRTRSVVPDPMLPTGPLGPHFYGDQVQGWFKGYGSWGERDSGSSYAGYDLTSYGAMAGLDKSYGEMLLGLAGGMAMTEISQTDGDSSDAETMFGMLYASWGTLSWFGDINLGYGKSSIDDQSGTAFRSHASYDADQFAFYLGGGREMAFREDRLFITPSAALAGSYYTQESYTEASGTALAKRVDDFDYFGFQTDLGVKVSYAIEKERSSLVPEVHANWLHELNADEERIGYSLVGGTDRYSFGMEAPVEDLYELGVALSWWRRGRSGTTEWSLGLDEQFGDGYSETTASLRLQKQF
ncbi:MAG: autotransporter domain-containing protein [Pontiellaceae bacterium]|nr:autotransporter domain-containing protein [Pontiellaceae bacterium]MBN2783585.1 autotransporter domain-containing protein [Pontiellaceae bacterium]